MHEFLQRPLLKHIALQTGHPSLPLPHPVICSPFTRGTQTLNSLFPCSRSKLLVFPDLPEESTMPDRRQETCWKPATVNRFPVPWSCKDLWGTLGQPLIWGVLQGLGWRNRAKLDKRRAEAPDSNPPQYGGSPWRRVPRRSFPWVSTHQQGPSVSHCTSW